MRINTNVGAINAHRNLTETNNAVSSSMQKLSSGFRINRAADDAAGLGIANKLRGDIRSMNQASRNADQANSLLQIAEGSVGSIQKMLERMKELATQAGSDTVDADGRTRIQDEFKALQDEITRTVETTKFQGTSLLKGAAGTPATPGTPLVPGTPEVTGAGTAGAGTVAADRAASIDFSATSLAVGTGYTITDDGTDITIADSDGNTVATAATGSAGDTIDFASIGLSITLGASYDSSDGFAGETFDVSATYAAEVPDTPAVPGTPAAPGETLSFLISSSEQYATNDALQIEVFNLELDTLGIDADTLATRDGALAALDNLDAAMSTVNSTLGKIGAYQNRVEYAQQNLKTSIQNFSAAESVIRDLDMAEEMTKFSKNNILSQAGTAMLAQANQSAQGVLQLLRG